MCFLLVLSDGGEVAVLLDRVEVAALAVVANCPVALLVADARTILHMVALLVAYARTTVHPRPTKTILLNMSP